MEWMSKTVGCGLGYDGVKRFAYIKRFGADGMAWRLVDAPASHQQTSETISN